MVFENYQVQVLIRFFVLFFGVWLFLISINKYLNFSNWQLAVLFVVLSIFIYFHYRKSFDVKEMI